MRPSLDWLAMLARTAHARLPSAMAESTATAPTTVALPSSGGAAIERPHVHWEAMPATAGLAQRTAEPTAMAMLEALVSTHGTWWPSLHAEEAKARLVLLLAQVGQVHWPSKIA